MKLYQIIQAFILTFFVSFCISSCNNDSLATNQEDKSNDYQTEYSDDDDDDDINDYEEISALSHSIQEIKKDLKDLEESTEKLSETKSNLWEIFLAWVFSALSLAVAIFALVKTFQYKKQIDSQKQKIESLSKNEQKNLSNSITPHNGRTPTISQTYRSSNDIDKLKGDLSKVSERVNSLERKIANSMTTQQSQGPIITPTPVVEPTAPKKPEKIQYFGFVVRGEAGNGYFKKILETQDNEARFSATVSGQTAEFEPIGSLELIKSYDYMDLAIEFNGVSKLEATSMTLIKPGVAKLHDGKWIITKKAMITLRK